MGEAVGVSVVIPAYNARDTIQEEIRSVQAQTVPVREVIVVDDGSADGTANVVREEFSSVRLFQVVNGGPSRARNYGIQVAEASWVAFLDADDCWHPQKVERQLKVLDEHPEVGLVASDWVRLYHGPPHLPFALKVSSVSYRQLLILNRFQTSTVIVKKSILEAVDAFDASLDGAEDWDLWVRVARIAVVNKVDEPLVMYRDVGTGYSKDVWRLFSTMKPMLEKHRDALPRDTFFVIEAWHYLRFWVAFRLLKDDVRAKQVLEELRSGGLSRYAPRAVALYLAPFLLRRWMRRARLLIGRLTGADT